jgi:hypothetical protein
MIGLVAHFPDGVARRITLMLSAVMYVIQDTNRVHLTSGESFGVSSESMRYLLKELSKP